jgi:hypothetical protein
MIVKPIPPLSALEKYLLFPCGRIVLEFFGIYEFEKSDDLTSFSLSTAMFAQSSFKISCYAHISFSGQETMNNI